MHWTRSPPSFAASSRRHAVKLLDRAGPLTAKVIKLRRLIHGAKKKPAWLSSRRKLLFVYGTLGRGRADSMRLLTPLGPCGAGQRQAFCLGRRS